MSAASSKAKPLASAIDRVPPQNLEAEQSVLGSMMLDKKALAHGIEMLSAADFYRPTHSIIFDALVALMKRDKPTDPIVLQEELRRRKKLEEIGGMEYLMALVDSVPTVANLAHYARIVEEKAVRRRLIVAAQEIGGLAWLDDDEQDLEQISAQAEHLVLAARDRRDIGIQSLNQGIDQVWDSMGRTQTTGPGIPIGLTSLEHVCIALKPGELTVVGARPGIGKSALTFDLLMHAAKRGYPGAVISLEMTLEQFATREISKASGVEVRRMFTGELEDYHWQKVSSAIPDLWDCGVSYVNAADWDMTKIAACARRLVAEGVKVIAIDHIQLVKAANPRAPRRDIIGQISADCKSLAMRLNIPVIALCQLSRNIEHRGANAEPTLSDLKESGDIEANADVVWLLWRREYEDNEPVPEVGEAKIIIGKNRMLPTGVVHCGYHGRRFKFVEMEEHHEDPGRRGKPATQKTQTEATKQ